MSTTTYTNNNYNSAHPANERRHEISLARQLRRTKRRLFLDAVLKKDDGDHDQRHDNKAHQQFVSSACVTGTENNKSIAGHICQREPIIATLIPRAA
jgi:hypothetical protein